MPLRACSRCGSTDLSVPKLEDGVVPETDNLGDWVCRRCGQKGIPIEFRAQADLRAFQDAVQASGGASPGAPPEAARSDGG